MPSPHDSGPASQRPFLIPPLRCLRGRHFVHLFCRGLPRPVLPLGARGGCPSSTPARTHRLRGVERPPARARPLRRVRAASRPGCVGVCLNAVGARARQYSWFEGVTPFTRRSTARSDYALSDRCGASSVITSTCHAPTGSRLRTRLGPRPFGITYGLPALPPNRPTRPVGGEARGAYHLTCLRVPDPCWDVELVLAKRSSTSTTLSLSVPLPTRCG